MSALNEKRPLFGCQLTTSSAFVRQSAETTKAFSQIDSPEHARTPTI